MRLTCEFEVEDSMGEGNCAYCPLRYTEWIEDIDMADYGIECNLPVDRCVLDGCVKLVQGDVFHCPIKVEGGKLVIRLDTREEQQ